MIKFKLISTPLKYFYLFSQSEYFNDKLEGDYIYYNDCDNISMVIKYHLGKIYKTTKFYNDGSVKLVNEYNDNNKLKSHKSFYKNGTKYMEIIITDDQNIYELYHYFNNEQIAWIATYNHIKKHLELDKVVIKVLYTKDGTKITLEEFDNLYGESQFKTCHIWYLFQFGVNNGNALLSRFLNFTIKN